MVNWKEEYSVNNKTMDDQHKELFLIVEEVFDLLNPPPLKTYGF